MLVEPVKNQWRKMVQVYFPGYRTGEINLYHLENIYLCWFELAKTIQFPPKYRQFFYINPLISLEKSTFYASKFLKRGEQQLCRPLVFWIWKTIDFWWPPPLSTKIGKNRPKIGEKSQNYIFLMQF